MPIKQFRIQACLANTLNPERFTELLVEEGSDVIQCKPTGSGG